MCFVTLAALSAFHLCAVLCIGLCKQAASVPGKYFLQLIRGGSRVVFTGKCMCIRMHFKVIHVRLYMHVE